MDVSPRAHWSFAQILQVEDIPYTLNGKRVEVPVKKVCLILYCVEWVRKAHARDCGDQIVNGAPISSINPATLRNPECLVQYEAIGKELRAEAA